MILKKKPLLEVILTRDSVCAGDDCDAPHDCIVHVPSFIDPVDFSRAVSGGYLPSVAGFGHSWICRLNGIQIAEIKVMKITPLVEKLVFEEKNTAHFLYRSSPS